MIQAPMVSLLIPFFSKAFVMMHLLFIQNNEAALILTEIVKVIF